jgi:hypothetical protein
VYAITFEEEDQEPDRFEAHGSDVGNHIILNVRDLDPYSPNKPWAFARYSFLLPSVLRVEVVTEEALADVEKSPSALRDAMQRLDGNPELYSDLCVCVRVAR